MSRLFGWVCVAVGLVTLTAPFGWWVCRQEWGVENLGVEVSPSRDGAYVAISFLRRGWAGVLPFCFEVVAVAPVGGEEPDVFARERYWVLSQSCPEVRSRVIWEANKFVVFVTQPPVGKAQTLRASAMDDSRRYQAEYVIQ